MGAPWATRSGMDTCDCHTLEEPMKGVRKCGPVVGLSVVLGKLDEDLPIKPRACVAPVRLASYRTVREGYKDDLRKCCRCG